MPHAATHGLSSAWIRTVPQGNGGVPLLVPTHEGGLLLVERHGADAIQAGAASDTPPHVRANTEANTEHPLAHLYDAQGTHTRSHPSGPPGGHVTAVCSAATGALIAAGTMYEPAPPAPRNLQEQIWINVYDPMGSPLEKYSFPSQYAGVLAAVPLEQESLLLLLEVSSWVRLGAVELKDARASGNTVPARGTVFFVGLDDGGQVRFAVELGHRIEDFAVLKAGIVALDSQGTRLRAWNADGTMLWERALSGALQSIWPAAHGGFFGIMSQPAGWDLLSFDEEGRALESTSISRSDALNDGRTDVPKTPPPARFPSCSHRPRDRVSVSAWGDIAWRPHWQKPDVSVAGARGVSRARIPPHFCPPSKPCVTSAIDVVWSLDGFLFGAGWREEEGFLLDFAKFNVSPP